MHTSLKSPQFGFRLGADLGQSSRTGSCKLLLTTDEDQKIAEVEIPQILAGDSSLTSSDQYVGLVAGHMHDLWQSNQNRLPAGDTLKSLTITTAGAPTKDGIVPALTGILVNGKAMSDINLGRLSQLLVQQGVPTARDLDDHMTIVNDMGGGLTIAYATLKDQLGEGTDWTYLMPGGGLGFAHLGIDSRHDEVLLKFTELGHFQPNEIGKNWESFGAASSGLVNNFFDALGIPMDDPHREEKRAEMVMTFEEAQNYFPDLQRDDYNRAANFAVDTFMDVLANAGQLAVLSSHNGLIIADTKVIQGVKQYVADHAERYGALEFEQILSNRILERLDPVGKGQFESLNFKILFLPIRNNTEGAIHLRHAVPTNDNNNAFAIPRKVFSPPGRALT